MLDLHGISRAAFDLVVAQEVTSQAAYERKYRRVLEYPGEQSGPTGGIGYDFGTQTRAQISADWGDKVDAGMLRILCGRLRQARRGGGSLFARDPRPGRYSLGCRARRVRQLRPAALSRHPRALLPWRRPSRSGLQGRAVVDRLQPRRRRLRQGRPALCRDARDPRLRRLAAISPASPA
jgi:hypothetical protein